MKLEFKVIFDTETKSYQVDPISNNVTLPFSGSSYLRVKPTDGSNSFYGTIGMYHPDWCYNNENELDCNINHLHWGIVVEEKCACGVNPACKCET